MTLCISAVWRGMNEADSDGNDNDSKMMMAMAMALTVATTSIAGISYSTYPLMLLNCGLYVAGCVATPCVGGAVTASLPWTIGPGQNTGDKRQPSRRTTDPRPALVARTATEYNSNGSVQHCGIANTLAACTEPWSMDPNRMTRKFQAHPFCIINHLWGDTRSFAQHGERNAELRQRCWCEAKPSTQ